jgi:hypothetical protein
MEDSIMEDSVFDNYGDDSDGFEPVVAVVCGQSITKASDTSIIDFQLTSQSQKTKVATKKTAAKVSKEPKPKAIAPKKLVQTKLKSTAKPLTKKRPKPESDEENDEPSELASVNDGSGFSNTPPSSKKQKKEPSKKSATDQYQKLTQ